jgi:hypothetical protein
MLQFLDCDKCFKWGEVPKDFNESKHFGQCPCCKGPMKLVHGDPKTYALRDANKVTPELMKQS